MGKNQIEKPFFSGILLQVLLKYYKQLSIISLIVIVLSSIISSSYFITPLYQSTVILYPTASNSISKVLLSETFVNSKDILEFGEDEQTEQMLQVLNSNKIRDRIIIKYNLLDHYGIKESDKFKMTQLYNEYDDKFKFRRTEYMAVKISVLDKNPQFAADMANDIAELVDSTINNMQKKIAIRAFKIVEEEYLNLKNQVRLQEDSLTVLRGLGVNDYESQSEMFNRQLAIEMAKGNNQGVARLQKKLDMLAKYGGPYVSIRDALEHDKKKLSALRSKYEEAKVDATESLPHKFIVSSAYKAEKKTYPIRWLIVLISTIASFFLAMLVLGFIEVFSDGIEVNLKKKRLKINIPHYLNYNKGDQDIKSRKNIKLDDTSSKDLLEEKDEEERDKKKENIDYVITEINDIEMAKFFNSSELLSLLDKWKVHLTVIVIIAAVLGGVFSGPAFITPLYKSHAVLYPANTDSYSEESETEQMLQIFNSQDIKDSVINKFKLDEHYNIDKNYKYYKSVLYNEYGEKIKIGKTPYEAVSIDVLDKNPDTAAMIANSLIHFYDKKMARLHKTKYVEVADMYRLQLQKKRNTIDSLKTILQELGEDYGIIEYSNQSQEIFRGLLGTYDGNIGKINKKEVERLKKNMEKYSGQLLEVTEMIQNEARTYVQVKLDYELAVRFIDSHMTYSNIVSAPFVSDRKEYPVRWIIVALAALAAFMFSSFIIMFIENRKK